MKADGVRETQGGEEVRGEGGRRGAMGWRKRWIVRWSWCVRRISSPRDWVA